MADKLIPKQNVRFIRVRGRVIPVRRNVSVRKGKGLLTKAGIAAEGKRRVLETRASFRHIPFGNPKIINMAGTRKYTHGVTISAAFNRTLKAIGNVADTADFLAGTGMEREVGRRFKKAKKLKSAKPARVWSTRKKLGLAVGAASVAGTLIAVSAKARE